MHFGTIAVTLAAVLSTAALLFASAAIYPEKRPLNWAMVDAAHEIGKPTFVQLAKAV